MATKKPRFTVEPGRTICRDGELYCSISVPNFSVGKPPPTEYDEFVHIVAALLNRLGDRPIDTTYLSSEGRAVSSLAPPRMDEGTESLWDALDVEAVEVEGLTKRFSMQQLRSIAYYKLRIGSTHRYRTKVELATRLFVHCKLKGK